MGLRWGCIAVVVVALLGCGGRTLPGQDVGARRDAPDLRHPVDSTPHIDIWAPDIESWPPLPPPPPPPRRCDPTIIGLPCSQHGGECGQGGTCLLLSQTHGGVCGCLCTPDDPNTPLVNEDDCPSLATTNLCGAVALTDGSTLNLCMRRCTPRFGANDCKAPLACAPSTTEHSGRLDQAVCLAIGCRSDADCPVRTGARCDTANPVTCTALETCVPLDEKTTRGACAQAGRCDAKSGLCAEHAGTATATIGSPCSTDTQCGKYMTCQLELDQQLSQLGSHGVSCTADKDCCGSCEASRCKGSCRVEQRGGYCTLRGCAFASSVKQWACPTGSLCNRMVHGGTCLLRCDPTKPDDCRGLGSKDRYGDYECYAWNNVHIGGVQVSDAPVCTPQVLPCDTFGSNAQLSCSSLGLPGNPTKMACRSLKTKQPLADARDASGFCLDTTSSGP